MTIKPRVVLLFACALLAGNHCNNPTLFSQSGGASETINACVIVTDTVACIALDTALGKPLSVHVYDAAYKPYEELGFKDSLSAVGMVVWGAPSAGTYNFYLTLESGRAAFVSGLELTQGISDTVRCVLKAGTDITGAFKQLTLPAVPEVYVLYIKGSPFVTVTDSSQRFILNNLPAGHYTLTTRPAARFFFTTTDYVINTDSLDDNTNIYLEIP